MNPNRKSRQWLNSIASVLVLLVVVGSGAWVLTDDETTAETSVYNPSSALPADVLFHLSYDGASGESKCRQLALAELWEEKQVKQFMSPVMNWANKMIDDASKDVAEDIGISPADLATLGRSHSTFTLIGVEMPENGPPIVDAIAMLDLGSNNELIGRIQTAVEKLLKEEAQVEVKMIDLGGVMVRGCEIDDGFEFMWTAMGSQLVMGTQVKTMTEVLTRMKAKSTKGGLMENQRFQAARSKVAPNGAPIIHAHANIESIIATVHEATEGDDEVAKFISLFGLDQISDYSYAINFEGRAIVDRIWAGTPSGTTGIMDMMKPSDVPMASMQLAPKDSFLYGGSRVDLSAGIEYVMDVVKEIEPDMHEQATSMLADLDEQLGFSIRKDLLPSIGNEWAMWVGQAPYGSMIPEIIVTAGVKDHDKVTGCMASAKEKFGKDAVVRSFKFMERDIHFCDLGKIISKDEIGFGMKPCWMLDGDNMIMALAPQTLKNYIASQRDQRDTIAKNQDVADAMAHFKRFNPVAGNTGFSYFDIASMITMLADTAAPLAQSMNMPKEAMMGLEIDFNMFPTGDVFRRHLFGFSAATTKTDRGMLSEMHSPFGYMGMVMAIAIPAGMASFVMESSGSSMPEDNWDELEPVKLEAEEIKEEESGEIK
ncbi:MAG: hypothetical protein ACI97A_001832 [Planctomycetota bacterium]|jgi:hypothetical protein